MSRPERLVLIGHPVAHSLSPRMHNAVLRSMSIPLEYQPLDVRPDELEATFQDLRSEEAAGNVTIPYKQTLFNLCDHVTNVAEAAEAVNTFWMQDGNLIGDNTDVPGFDITARSLLETARRELPARIAVIGAGGGAAAVAAATASWQGTELAVWSRNAERAEAFAKRFVHARAFPELRDALKNADLVVNATPTGLAGDQFPIPIESLPRNALVIDLAYRIDETPWVRAARAEGHMAMDGLPMLVEQAARSFRRWMGIEPDRAVMWGALS